jgi:hypothetical protein
VVCRGWPNPSAAPTTPDKLAQGCVTRRIQGPTCRTILFGGLFLLGCTWCKLELYAVLIQTMTQSGNLVPRGLTERMFAFLVIRNLFNVWSRLGSLVKTFKRQRLVVTHVLRLSARSSRDTFAVERVRCHKRESSAIRKHRVSFKVVDASKLL